MKTIIPFLLVSILSIHLNAQEKPLLYGVAKMTFLVSSFDLAKEYYGDFLGFEKAFSYPSDFGIIASYKINDRQFIEFVEDKEAAHKDRLFSVSFETDNVKKMEEYLLSKNISVVKKVHIDGAGNKVLLVYDPSGVPVEFIEYGSQSLHRQSKGKHLSPNRIATRIHHVGLYSKELEDQPTFYTQILGFEKVLRVPQNLQEKPRILYFRIPGSSEMVEHYPTIDRNFNHPCFVTMDIQETLSILRERKKTETLGAPSLGLGKRWLLNLTNRDGTKVEFTEPYISTF